MPAPLLPLMTTLAPMIVNALSAKANLPKETERRLMTAVAALQDNDLKPDERLKAEMALTAVLERSDERQMTLNQRDAVSTRFWQAGWRPFIGWVCGMAFCWHFLIGPMVSTIAGTFGYPFVGPSFEMEALNTTLFGLLGLGAMRSYEKVKGLNGGR